MEALPEVASLPNPQDHVQLVVSAFADLLERKNADDSPDTSLVRGTRHIAMTHVDTYGNEMFTEAIEGLSMNRGESESLQNVSFLTDLDQNEWEEIDSANALSSEEQAIEKSGPQNAKESYDIRGRAGFFSKNKASSSSLNLAGPLVYPKEFSQPKSQLSMKAQAEADVAEIAKTIEKNGVSHATHSNSR